MNDTEAFLRKIRENPDDDAPRLVFADYLDEQAGSSTGKAAREQSQWAALIRAQIASERETFADASFWNKWAGVDVGGSSNLAYKLVPKNCHDEMWLWPTRGFYDQFDFDLEDLFVKSDSLLESLTPVRKMDIDLYDDDWEWNHISEDPVLGLIRNLDLSSNFGMSDTSLELIMNDTQLRSLTELNIQTMGSYDSGYLSILKTCQEFPALRSLTGAFEKIKDYRELLKYPFTENLEILAGENSSIECGNLYSQAPLAKTLTWLELDENKEYVHKKWKWGHLPNLKRIGIEMIGEKDWLTPFLESQDFQHLSSLELRGKTMIPNVLEPLESGKGEFSLSLEKMSRPTLKGILNSPTMQRVHTLILEGKSMEYAIEILSNNNAATNLRSLKIAPEDGIKNPVPFFKTLSTSPVFANLLHLEIPKRLTLTDMKRIASSGLGQSLRAFSCYHPQLPAKWQEFLRDSSNFPNLIHLSWHMTDLDENKLAKGRKKLKLI